VVRHCGLQSDRVPVKDGIAREQASVFESFKLEPPAAVSALRERLLQLGYSVSEIVDRDYGQTEFFVTDDDGYSHCFGVATNKSGPC
jgi:hypothetical protein